MKLVKTRLRSRINDRNLARLIRIATEGPELVHVDFNEILDIFKAQNHRIQLFSYFVCYFNLLLHVILFSKFLGGGGGGGGKSQGPPLMKHCQERVTDYTAWDMGYLHPRKP